MPAKSKLTPEQWTQVYATWQADARPSLAWLVDELALPISEQGIRDRARRDGWTKEAMLPGQSMNVQAALKEKPVSAAKADARVEVMIGVVCEPDGAGASSSLGFVTALQDSYNLKKSNNSASLGVGGVGPVSLPFMTGGGESLVKVGSPTIDANDFYDSFFDLVKRFLLSNESPAPSEAADALDAPD